MRLVWLTLWACTLACAQVKELDITGSQTWTDTGLDVKSGDTVKITATGTLQYPASKASGPEGLPRGFKDLLRILPVNDIGRGALVGRIGDNTAARPFYVGAMREVAVGVPGRLFLGLNQMGNDQPEGSLHVRMERTAGSAADEKIAAKLPQALLDSLPSRVSDATGIEGDRVNFIVIGSEDKLRTALANAGWVPVDRTTKDAVLRGLLTSLSKQAYTTLPMSELRLFGRPQDFGYAQGDPYMVVASRHHFRIWRAPFLLEGQTVWVGAGTHDIGFDKDQRNGNLTHKIDPDTDKEREYIGESLRQAGAVIDVELMTPKTTITAAKTAHGEAFSSDGRISVIYLRPDKVNNSQQRFADLFCSVLAQNNPDTGDWGDCAQYVNTKGRTDIALKTPPTNYRVLIVPGIMSSCVASQATAFAEGRKVLQDKYGISAELINIPNDSSEENAKKIAQYLTEHRATDQRKYIVVGYSKGAPDLQVALAQEPGVKDAVAALVTVAGAVGGSAVAETLPSQADKYIRMFNLKGCEGDLATGFKSLRRDVRQAFLNSNPKSPVPAYSIAAASDRDNTSKALLETWLLLAAESPAQDGQLTSEDATVPGAKYLGVAKGDHFAVALPFDKSPDQTVRLGMDKSRFPRAALLEALVRLVTEDLSAGDTH